MQAITIEEMIKALSELPPQTYISGFGNTSRRDEYSFVVLDTKGDTVLEIPLRRIEE